MKILHTLQNLSTEEQSELAQYLACPLLGNSPMLRRLLQVCLDFLGEKQANEADLYARMYPGEPFRKSHFRRNLSLLQKQVEEYLAFCVYRSNPQQRRFNRLQAMDRPGWEGGFASYFQQEQKALRDAVARGEEIEPYLQLQSLHEEWVSQKGLHPEGLRFQVQMDLQEQAFALKRLRLACLAANHDLSHGTEHRFPEHLAGQLSGISEKSPLLLQIYAEVWGTLQGQEAAYLALRQHLRDSGPLFSPKIQRELYDFARNFCMRRLNAKDLSYREELWALHEEMEQRETLLEKGKLPLRDLKNFVVLYLQTGANAKAHDFFHRNREKVSGEGAHLGLLHIEAVLYFERGEFENTQKLLRKAVLQQGESLDPLFGLDIFGYLLRVQYELGLGDEVERLGRNFQRRLSRAKYLEPSTRKRYQHFSRKLRELSAIREGKPSKREQRLKSWKESLDRPVFSRWLLTKASKLSKE